MIFSAEWNRSVFAVTWSNGWRLWGSRWCSKRAWPNEEHGQALNQPACPPASRAGEWCARRSPARPKIFGAGMQEGCRARKGRVLLSALVH